MPTIVEARPKDQQLVFPGSDKTARLWPLLAATLAVSVSTVKTHVANLLAKIGCRDRVQAIIYAYEHGVVESGSCGEPPIPARRPL